MLQVWFSAALTTEKPTNATIAIMYFQSLMGPPIRPNLVCAVGIAAQTPAGVIFLRLPAPFDKRGMAQPLAGCRIAGHGQVVSIRLPEPGEPQSLVVMNVAGAGLSGEMPSAKEPGWSAER